MYYNAKMHFRSRAERGYVALMTTLVVGFILLGLSVQEGISGWYARYNVLSSQNKEQSSSLAEGCADQALAEIVANPSYSNTIDTTTAQGTCHVTIDTSVSHLATIKSQGIVQGSYANLEMSVNLSDVHIGSTPTTPTSGTLVVYVSVKNDNSGTSPLSAFTISVPTAIPPSPSSFSNVPSEAVSILGNYQVSETGPTGYSTSFSGDCNSTGAGTVAAGEVKTCTVAIDDIPTTLTLIANVTNNGAPPGTRQASDFQLKIDGNNVAQNVPISVTPGPHTASGPGADSSYTVSTSPTWGYDCATPGTGTITLAPGDQKTCVINYDDIAPTLSCAETVMMLDRTHTFFAANAQADEEAAADALLDLYGALATPPKVGVGSFGGMDGSQAAVTAAGYMTTTYGTKGGAGGSVGANFPTSTTTPKQFTNGNNAFANDALFAVDSTNGHQQSYINFGLPAIPASATITGIEVVVDGKVSGGASQSSGRFYPSNTGNYNSWTANGSVNKSTDVDGTDANDNTYINTSTNNNVQTYVLPNAGLAAGSVVNAVSFYAIARGTSNGASIKLRLENGTAGGHQWDDGNHGLSTSYATYQYNNASTTNPATGNPWTLNDVNSWGNAGGIRFGVVRTNSAAISPRVTQIYALINYTPPPTGNVGVALSKNNGGAWLSIGGQTKTTPNLSSAESAQTLGNNSDLWAEAPGFWVPSDFTNGKFAVRLTNNIGAGITTSLNYVTAKIYYSIPASGLYALVSQIDGSESSVGTWQNVAIAKAQGELTNVSRHVSGKQQVMVLVSDGVPNGPTTAQVQTAASTAKGSPNNIQIFAMHFGDSSGTANMQQWVSPSTLPVYSITATGAKRVGNTVTVTTTGTHQLAKNQRVVISGISGAGSCSSLNGTYPVASVGASPATTFTYLVGNGTLNCGNGTVTATNLFEAPQSVDMSQVFTAIGTQACPALAAASTPPPTKGTLTVITSVSNNDGTGSKAASNFTMTVATSTPQTFLGAESPGVSIPIVPGNYGVTGTADPTNYSLSYGINCSSAVLGPIAAGETRTCIVNYDDIPTPPSPPNLDINLGSWQEKPK